MFVIPLRAKIDESVNSLRTLKGQPASDLFTTQAIEMLSEGLLDGYEIPGLPKAVRSNACLLHTAGVAGELKQQGYEAQYDAKAGLFCARKSALAADAVAATMQ